MEIQNLCLYTKQPLHAFVEQYIPGLDTAATIASYVKKPFSWLDSAYAWLYDIHQKPIPPSARGHLFFGSAVELARYKWNIFKFLVDYEATFGHKGFCKLQLGTKIFYIVSDALIAQKIFSFPKSFPRGESLRFWREFSPNGLSEGNETEKLRKKALDAIGHQHYEHFFPSVSKVSIEWIDRLKQEIGVNESVDIMRECERLGLAAIGESLFKLNALDPYEINPFCLDVKNDSLCSEFLDSFHTLFELITKRIASPVANFPIKGDAIYDSLYPDDKLAFTVAKGSIEKILLGIYRQLFESRDKIDPESDFYKIVVGAFGVDINNPDYNLILDESMGFLQAAFETSSKALGWAIYSLAVHEDIQSSLYEQLKKEFGDDRPTSMEALYKVPLLFQVIEETLRLYTPFPFLLRDVKDSSKFTDYEVKNGETFIIAPYFMHKNCWKDGDRFIPERFSEVMLTDSWQRNNSIYGTFIKGPHTCPGRFFAKQELAIALVDVVLNFKMKFQGPIPKPKLCITLQTEKPLYVHFEERAACRLYYI